MEVIIPQHLTAVPMGTAGLIISLLTCLETAVPIRIGSISLYFLDCLFGEDRRRKHSGARLNRQVPDALWSTKHIEIKYLAQGYKHAGSSGARTHNIDGLVIMSFALFC